MLFVKPLCSIVLIPSSAILTNLTLFIFHVPNTTVLLFTVKPLRNLSLLLSVQPHMELLCAWWNTHTMTVLHHGLYNFTLFFFLLDFQIVAFLTHLAFLTFSNSVLYLAETGCGIRYFLFFETEN